MHRYTFSVSVFESFSLLGFILFLNCDARFSVLRTSVCICLVFPETGQARKFSMWIFWRGRTWLLHNIDLRSMLDFSNHYSGKWKDRTRDSEAAQYLTPYYKTVSLQTSSGIRILRNITLYALLPEQQFRKEESKMAFIQFSEFLLHISFYTQSQCLQPKL